LESDLAHTSRTAEDSDDPLLKLFGGEPLPVEAFHEALRQQRGSAPDVSGAAAHA
jgi:hypothetical protein